jgi:hypothetical protein
MKTTALAKSEEMDRSKEDGIVGDSWRFRSVQFGNFVSQRIQVDSRATKRGKG